MKNLIKPVLIALGLASMMATSCVQEVDINDEVKPFKIGIFVNETEVASMESKHFEPSDYKNVEIGEAMVSVLPISTIIRKSKPEIKTDQEFDVFLQQYNCDYESSKDGFRPSIKGDRCAPVSCELTKTALYNPLDQSLGYAPISPMYEVGCYNIRDLGKILMFKKLTASYGIEVVIDDDAMIPVDLSDLSKHIKHVDAKGEKLPDGKGIIYLDKILQKANAEIDLSLYNCDFESSDGYRPSKSPNCKTVRSCEFAKTAYVYVNAPHDMVMTDADAPACYSTKGLKKIVVSKIGEDFGYESHPLDVIVDASLKASVETNNFDKTDYEIVTVGDDKLTAIAISKIIRKAHPEITTDVDFDAFLADYSCDYEGYDGFKASQKCPVVDCSLATKSYFSLTQNKLVYDASTPMASKNCYGIGNPKSIIMSKKALD